MTHRPDDRPAAIVWKYFLEAFKTDFPNVSWALGSDWGMGQGTPRDAAHYQEMAEARMTAIYGERTD